MRAHFVIAAPYWMRRGDDKPGVPLTPGPSPTGRGEPNPTWVDRILGRGRGRECHVAALLAMTGVGTALTPTLSRWERERFYLDEPDGQDWGGYGIANPCIEYGVAMTKRGA